MEIIIATSNQHKVEEFKKILQLHNVEVKSLLDYDFDFEVDENGDTFGENALIKARELAKKLNKCVISDDSGLVIDALNGEPGIKSARYLGLDTSYTYKNSVILERMNSFVGSDRSCRFVCAIAYIDELMVEHVFEGAIEGVIGDKINGENGFGYDPIFYLPQYNKSLAQLDDVEKNKISHRYIAIEKFLEYITNEK